MLQPFGVLVGADDQSEDVDDEGEVLGNQECSTGNAQEAPPSDLLESTLELEDIGGAEAATSETTSGKKRPNPRMLVNRKRVPKARVFREALKYRGTRGSRGEPSRGGTRCAKTVASIPNMIGSESALGGPTLGVGNPAATLIRCQGQHSLRSSRSIESSLNREQSICLARRSWSLTFKF